MSNSGKGGNRKNRHRFLGKKEEPQKPAKKTNENIFPEPKFEKNRENSHERPRWTAPVLPANPTSSPDCPWCGKPIKDISNAISDKDSGQPVHFDCVLARISENERLEKNDSVCYIGGGRFGIIHYNNPADLKNFTIKKILEWEVKGKQYEWRRPFSEYFSVT